MKLTISTLHCVASFYTILRAVKLDLFSHWNMASSTAVEGLLLSKVRSARSYGSEQCWLAAAALESKSLKVKMELRSFHGYAKLSYPLVRIIAGRNLTKA